MVRRRSLTAPAVLLGLASLAVVSACTTEVAPAASASAAASACPPEVQELVDVPVNRFVTITRGEKAPTLEAPRR